jgi:Methyltransferase FkbM domain
MKRLLLYIYNYIDRKLKFPALKKGETGIQIGFDMAHPLTGDLFKMYHCCGHVIGIDPDTENIKAANVIIHARNLNIQLVEKAVYFEKTTTELLLGEKASWNQINAVPVDDTVSFSGKKQLVETDTLDNILDGFQVDFKKIGHINITNNGAEYATLLGMKRLLANTHDIALTVVAGRQDPSGMIDDVPDYKRIIEFLKQEGFRVRFRRINQLFWWGFVTKLLFNKKWIYNQINYGVVMAARGRKKIPRYQSFS